MSNSRFFQLLSGEPNIDVDDWEKNEICRYFTKNHQIEWFWKIVEDTIRRIVKTLHFATGSRRPPVGGFAYLMDLVAFTNSVHGVKSEGHEQTSHCARYLHD